MINLPGSSPLRRIQFRFLQCAAILLSAGLYAISHAGEVEIITTDFSELEKGTPVVAAPPMAPDALRLPSQVTNPEGSERSAILVAEEGIDRLSPPFASILVPRAEDGRDSARSTVMRWDLRDFSLESGRVRLQFDYVQLAGDGANRAFFNFVGGDGDRTVETSPDGNPIHISARTAAVSFNNDSFRAGRQSRKIDFGVVNEVIMEIDMSQRTWSASLNGEPVLQDSPFSGKLADTSVLGSIASFEISTQGGLDGKAGAEYAVGNVKLTHQAE